MTGKGDLIKRILGVLNERGVRLYPYTEAIRSASYDVLRLAGCYEPEDPHQIKALSAYRELNAALAELGDAYQHIEKAANTISEMLEKEQQKK
jgi:hypothetical protein